MTTTQNEHSLEQLQQWAAALEIEIEQIRGDISPLEQRLAAARERLDLIQRLMRLTEGAVPRRAAGSSKSVSAGDSAHPQAGKQDLEFHLESILREAGKPLHISKIREALVDRAIPLPGRGDEANIIIRLRRAPERFTRTGRGTYALATLGLDAVPPAKRRRRIRARRKA
jgi:hypothetical protein